MVLPLPNQLSSSAGPEPRPLPITALPTCFSSQYIDFLVNDAIEAATRLPHTDKDMLHHCDHSARLDLPVGGFGLHERKVLSQGTPSTMEEAASHELEDGEVLAVRQESSSSVKRTLSDSDDAARDLSIKVQKTECSMPVSVSTSDAKKIRKNEGAGLEIVSISQGMAGLLYPGYATKYQRWCLPKASTSLCWGVW